MHMYIRTVWQLSVRNYVCARIWRLAGSCCSGGIL